MFGACLSSTANGAATDGSTWTPNAGCPMTDGVHWKPIPAAASSAGSKIASAPFGTVNATTNLRFGVRAAPSQPTGRYIAPVMFEVFAPNV